jgi:hypothetical protein
MTFIVFVSGHCDIAQLSSFEVPTDLVECKNDFDFFVSELKNNVGWAVDGKFNFLKDLASSLSRYSFSQFATHSRTSLARTTLAATCSTLAISTNVLAYSERHSMESSAQFSIGLLSTTRFL